MSNLQSRKDKGTTEEPIYHPCISSFLRSTVYPFHFSPQPFPLVRRLDKATALPLCHLIEITRKVRFFVRRYGCHGHGLAALESVFLARTLEQISFRGAHSCLLLISLHTTWETQSSGSPPPRQSAVFFKFQPHFQRRRRHVRYFSYPGRCSHPRSTECRRLFLRLTCGPA